MCYRDAGALHAWLCLHSKARTLPRRVSWPSPKQGFAARIHGVSHLCPPHKEHLSGIHSWNNWSVFSNTGSNHRYSSWADRARQAPRNIPWNYLISLSKFYFSLCWILSWLPGVVEHTDNPSTWDTEARGWPWVQGQLGYHSNSASKKWGVVVHTLSPALGRLRKKGPCKSEVALGYLVEFKGSLNCTLYPVSTF